MADDQTKTETTTDQEILSRIDLGDDDSSDTTTTEETPTETTKEDVTETEETKSSTTVPPPTKASGGPDKKGPEQKSKPAPTNGDLLGADGKVVARAGAERRFYETAVRERTRADKLQRDIDTMKIQLDAFKESNSIGTQLNLRPDEVVAGAKIVAAFKENPVETVKYLLTQAQALGHNVEGIGVGTDLKAFKQLLDTYFKPIHDDRAKQEEATRVQQEAKQQYDNFVSQYPDALVHADTLATLLERDQSGALTPELAYFKLKAYYLERGLDWSKPLHVIEKEQKAPTTTTKGGGTQPGMPKGRPIGQTVQATEIAEVDTPLEDIIRSAMREAGIGSTTN